MSRLLAIGHSVPQHYLDSKQALAFVTRVLEAGAETPAQRRSLRLVERVFPRVGVASRYSCIPDYARDDPAEFTFFPPNWKLEPFPPTSARMRLFEQLSVDLTEEAARLALARGGVASEEVTHIVMSTCTGFFAPGPELHLIDRLGLRPDVVRTVLGFMGCYAGLTAMRVVDDIIRAHPEAVVLQIALELGSLHFQKQPVADLLIADALFGDGCAAAIYRQVDASESGGFEVLANRVVADRCSSDQMSWRIGDHGFEMRLGAEVPATIGDAAAPFVDRLVTAAGLGRSDLAGFAVHPGGVPIIEAVRGALDLEDRDVAVSLDCLRDFGNLSSASILFVLERLLEDPPQGPIAALAFGPGLTIEGAVLCPV